MSEPRLIKKYPNRRLYDTSISRYITLEEIKKLILSHIDFKVLDSNSQEDLTNYVLLQIINESEAKHQPIFTKALLLNIIRFYGNPMQQMMSDYLEKGFAMFNKTHGLENESLFEKMADLTQQNFALWQSAFAQYFSKKDEPSTP